MFFVTKNQKPFLIEILGKRIFTDDGNPFHILLDGDILLAMRCLQDEYAEGIDLIFADPPNVEDTLFKTLADSHAFNLHNIFPGKRESDHQLINWLYFLERRIALSYSLLKSDGCFFLSVSHRHAAHLKLICDHIFSAENYITTFTIKTRHESRVLTGDVDIHNVTEQLLFYRKSSNYKPNRLLKRSDELLDYVYEIETLNPNPERKELGGKIVEIYAPNEYTIRKGKPAEHKLKKISIRGSICDGNSSGRFFERYLKNLHQTNHLYKVPEIGSDSLGFRYFQGKKDEKFKNGFYYQGKPQEGKTANTLPFPNYFDFENEYTHVYSEGGIPFSQGKKPVGLMKLMLNIGIKAENAVILDMFAGSGSLAHAAMELNKMDQLKRKVISCDSSEHYVPEKVMYPRLKNVIEGYELNRVKKDELYSFPLTAEIIRENSHELNKKLAFFQQKHEGNYEKITEIIEDQCYKIYGVSSKNYNVEGVGNSLKYFKVLTNKP
ncbi:MAG: site-specific DNA-methyltransferase [Bacteroidales bacterium]|jgi:adenine specific DNA methylase Mod|nr:site-specific DNA-methyltransferase [Bacteroidales bacterium]